VALSVDGDDVLERNVVRKRRFADLRRTRLALAPPTAQLERRDGRPPLVDRLRRGHLGIDSVLSEALQALPKLADGGRLVSLGHAQRKSFERAQEQSALLVEVR
jgi:hypothetical protein